jgi:hypothetical protein
LQAAVNWIAALAATGPHEHEGEDMEGVVNQRQGDLALLEDAVARELLDSQCLARLAYNWRDGTPRVVPIWFQWNGREFVVSSPPRAPRLKVLASGWKVALTIDRDTWPYHVLMIRGTANVEMVDGVPEEYSATARRYMGVEQGEAWSSDVAARFPRMARIAITPDWAGVVDFERRFPSALA